MGYTGQINHRAQSGNRDRIKADIRLMMRRTGSDHIRKEKRCRVCDVTTIREVYVLY